MHLRLLIWVIFERNCLHNMPLYLFNLQNGCILLLNLFPYLLFFRLITPPIYSALYVRLLLGLLTNLVFVLVQTVNILIGSIRTFALTVLIHYMRKDVR